MKRKYFIALLIQFFLGGVSFGGEIASDYFAHPFYAPKLKVEWKMDAKSLPKTVRIFKIVDGCFSQTTISNLMRLGGFSENDRVGTTLQGIQIPQNVMSFRNFDDRHYLFIAPASGTVELYTPDISTAVIEGVPDQTRGFELATNILRQLEVPTDQLIKTNGQLKTWFYPGEMTRYPKGAEPITRRSHMGVEFRRMLDGIPCFLEKVDIDFERNEKITQLQICWHEIKPSKPYPIASFDQMADWIRAGRARVNDLEGPSDGRFLQPTWIKKITILDVSFYYTASSYTPESSIDEVPLSQMYPYAVLKADAELGPDDHETIWLFCPVTEAALIDVSRKSDQYGFGIYPSNFQQRRK